MCEQCKNLTTGKQCQDCMPGYYGDPTNGGQCTGNFFFFQKQKNNSTKGNLFLETNPFLEMDDKSLSHSISFKFSLKEACFIC